MKRHALTVLHQEIDARVSQMQRSHGPWPCAAGCDTCCHRLGALPQLSEPEFDLLWPAIEALDDARAVVQAIEDAHPDPDGRWTCPLLDPDRGRCRVYAARPVACRTYGFYAGREGDYWCERVTDHLGPRRDSLVAGNQVAVDRQRDQTLGPSRDLAAWVRTRTVR